MIDEVPCEIQSYSKSKPGKHGSAKARIEGKGVFDNQNRTFTQPVDAQIEVPIVERKQGQIVNVEDGEMQVMDLDSYDTFQMVIDADDEPSPDDEIEFLQYESQRKIVE